LTQKRVELLSELVPKADAIALLMNPHNQTAERMVQNVLEAANVKLFGPAPDFAGLARSMGWWAADFDEQRRICATLQRQLWEHVPFIRLGDYWQATAYRNCPDRSGSWSSRRLSCLYSRNGDSR
jgi:hypothetical protein